MKRKISILSNILIMTFASILTTMNISADNTIGKSLGESETIGTSSLSKVFGDVNCDGVCNILDTIALKNYLIEGKENQFYNYDINQNGSIDKFDLYNLNQIVTGEVETLEDIPLYYKISDQEVQEYYEKEKNSSLNGWSTFRFFRIRGTSDRFFDLKLLELDDNIVEYYGLYSNKEYLTDENGNKYVEIDVVIRIKDTSVPNLVKVYFAITRSSELNIYSMFIANGDFAGGYLDV